MLNRFILISRGARFALTIYMLAAVSAINVSAGDSDDQQFRIPTRDGGVVFAQARGTGEHGVVLVPGGRFTHASWESQARVLARHGYRTLAIDLRGRGNSVAGNEPDGHDLDVLAAIEFLHQTGTGSVSVVGASFGGGAAAEAATAAGPGKVSGLVLLAASSVDAPERIPGHKLFIAARDDFRGEGILRLPEMRDQYRRAPGPKRLLVVDGSAHAQALFGTDSGEQVMDEIIAFLDEVHASPAASRTGRPDAARVPQMTMAIDQTDPACPDDSVATAADAIAAKFEDYPFIFIGSTHGGAKRHEFLLCLLSRTDFQSAVTDILVEFISGAHQELLDNYLLRLKPLARQALRPLAMDTDRPELFATLPQVPDFLAAVRAVNEKLGPEGRMRVIGGSETIRWDEVAVREDLARFPFKTNWSAHVVVEHLAPDRHRRTLVVYGDGGHILHGGTLTGDIEAFIDPSELFVIGTIRELKSGERDLVSAFGNPAAAFFVAEQQFPDLSSMAALPDDLYDTPPGELKKKIDALVYLGPSPDRDLTGTLEMTTDEARELERRRQIKNARETLMVRLSGRKRWFASHPKDLPDDPRTAGNNTDSSP